VGKKPFFLKTSFFQISYLSAETMHHVAGYWLPGLVFSILGLRWALGLICQWSAEAKENARQNLGLLPISPSLTSSGIKKQGKKNCYCC